MQTELTPEQLQDGLAFAKLMEDEKTWPALQRLIRKLHDDCITRWEKEDLSKKWLAGSREMAGAFIPALTQLALDAQGQIDGEKESRTAHPLPEEGLGAGDLAIA